MIAVENITNASTYNGGLELSKFNECFEGADYDWHYEFISVKGIGLTQLD
jgi:hypothetical protein